jgi:N-formylmaleamate deformylase
MDAMQDKIAPHGHSEFVVAGSLRHHYLRYGNGPPIVVVPGITSPAITWEFVAETLADEFAVYTLDVRGRGLTDRAASGAHRLPDYAADVAAVVEALTLDRPAVVGHSMGARIAAALGALHPDAHGALVLVDPPLTGPGRDPYPFPLEIYVEQLRAAAAGATADDIRPFFPSWPERELRIRAEWLATCDETAVVETYENFHREDFFGYWSEVRAPVAFLYGEDSPVVTGAAIEEVREANPAAELVGIPAAGHMVPWDNLDAFVAATRSFLRAAS